MLARSVLLLLVFFFIGLLVFVDIGCCKKEKSIGIMQLAIVYWCLITLLLLHSTALESSMSSFQGRLNVAYCNYVQQCFFADKL